MQYTASLLKHRLVKPIPLTFIALWVKKAYRLANPTLLLEDLRAQTVSLRVFNV